MDDDDDNTIFLMEKLMKHDMPRIRFDVIQLNDYDVNHDVCERRVDWFPKSAAAQCATSWQYRASICRRQVLSIGHPKRPSLYVSETTAYFYNHGVHSPRKPRTYSTSKLAY